MPLVIRTNAAALNTSRLLNQSSSQLQKSLARLSTGSRIVSPEDDPAGLAQSIKFLAQIQRTNAANVNVGNAISFSHTQDGFLQKVQSALDRLSELSVLAQDATKTATDLSNYTAEFTQLQNYVSDITNKTFNSVTLFSSTGLNITIDSDGTTFAMNTADLSSGVATGVLNAYSGISVSSVTAAITALNNIKTAIQALATMRAQVGANLQRLNLSSEQLTIVSENLTAANSRISDVDVAQESTKFAKLNILVQSGTSMLAQANVLPQSALRLVG